jgi:tartrate-resistant acid phosphatase type 5
MRAITLILLIMLCIVFNAYAQPKVEKHLWGKTIKGIEYDKDAIRFLVIGDWGKNGQANQQDVADWMGIAADQNKAQFVLTTGDNLYCCGVASVDDPQWMFSYENVYKAHSLNMPWFACLGNHDYQGSIQAQMDYGKKSQRWKLPAPYYTFAKKNLRIIVMDTNPFVQKYYTSETQYPELAKQDTTRQIQWLDSVLANAKEDWKIVVGHHPIYTTGPHKNQQELHTQIKPLLEKYNAQIYFAGHDHTLQYNKVKDSKVHYLISGGGSETYPVTTDPKMTVFAKETTGFMLVSLKDDKLKVWFINEKGEVIYQTEISK